MARNLREGSLGQVNVRVDTDVYGGWVYEFNGVVGVAVSDAAAGEVVALDRRPYVHYLFSKDTGAAPPPADAVDALKPEIPYAGDAAAGALAVENTANTLAVAVIEDGDADNSIYNTPAGHWLVTILP